MGAQLAQPLLERLEDQCGARVGARQYPDPMCSGLLRLDGERRGEETNGGRSHERPPVHDWITLSPLEVPLSYLDILKM
jgi:hypothetical protein